MDNTAKNWSLLQNWLGTWDGMQFVDEVFAGIPEYEADEVLDSFGLFINRANRNRLYAMCEEA